jgi:hypothetical protein
MKSSFPRYLSCLGLAMLLGLWAVPAAAQEGEAPEGEAPADDPAMAAMMASMVPGPQHEKLASMTGTWTITMKFWMDPGAEPQSSTGTAERSMILDGRILEERVTSDVMGMPFHGLGHTGYDNVTGEWWSTWMDNMGTGVMQTHGTVDEETHTATWEGEMSDPMTGGKTPMKIVAKHEGPDREVVDFYGPAPGGGDMIRTMQLVYERQQ